VEDGVTDQDKWKEALEPGEPSTASSKRAPASRDDDFDDDDDEVAPIGNRRSEPPTSGAPEELVDRNAAERGRRGRGGAATSGPGASGGGRGRGSLGADDPFWQFGTPVELWGSTRPAGPQGAGARKPGAGPKGGDPAKKRYLECRRCGVKIEAKRNARQQRGKMACPTCGRWMESR
jgi:hypothetical protein